jgi:CMP/dCMP kinase
MNIVISGLTAAGKTTHARLLATHLGFNYVSASQLLAAAAGIEVTSEEHWWVANGPRLAAARRSGGVDEDIDRQLVALAQGKDNTVFDAWALPWTSNAPMIRIWLQSDFPSRCRKCFVSHLGEGVSYSDCVATVEEKDAESQAIFEKLYGFDLYSDHDIFDVIVDLSGLIPQPTEECSRQSIVRADQYLRAAVASLSGASVSGLDVVVEEFPPGAIVRGPGTCA